tara:strand:- start:12064 stop:12267 length:204 start_codon:yes stop_codon:yes gene_type:complete
MRRIRIGDRVQAFLDNRIVGTVLEIKEAKNAPWMVGGTASSEFVCVLKLDAGPQIEYKMSELHHCEA